MFGFRAPTQSTQQVRANSCGRRCWLLQVCFRNNCVSSSLDITRSLRRTFLSVCSPRSWFSEDLFTVTSRRPRDNGQHRHLTWTGPAWLSEPTVNSAVKWPRCRSLGIRDMAALAGGIPRMVRPTPPQNYPRGGYSLEGRALASLALIQ